MDASNAFNSLNRIAALWNVRVLWPSVLSLFLIHTEGGHLWYSEDMMHHFIVSHKAIHYRCSYNAVGSLPLISFLQQTDKWKQIWYADDATSIGTCHHLREWFDNLIKAGPSYGYYPELL